MNLNDNLKWRYATKKMNGKAVPEEKLQYILEAAQLAPSSSGLQPYSVLVISNKELKEKMKPIAWDQSQLTDASHVLVFAAWENYTEEKIKEVFSRTIKERGLPETAMDAYRERLWGMYSQMPEEWHFHHAAKQAYIAFGLAIAAAAEQKVDATPMEGFDAAAMDELLNLKEKGLRSVTILPLGYRDENNDWLVNMKKVRTPKDKFFIELN
ncbi:NAD(P)H-dependent oxidoreductase [Prolixibacter denitrificans]|uniref:Nitroreductase n=1 Tax=Prolixibacter denitrificans TaxID=1541063 RepID=A0A2P8C6J3_9BACT|nr:NAD(P)H-dependent oxidoreductase [Prolixibacter denitrificans]PSK80586.1 nitroreductase [Prolixibacter denitrificans]GET22120.1 nitroreductase [Prolixibacter denitrificans]